MNDFTKMELIALEDAMKNMLLIHCPQDGKSPLLDKIQSMIDNYCDPMICHHKTENWEPAYQCEKCKKYYGMQIFDKI